jgi:hypothetical protein
MDATTAANVIRWYQSLEEQLQEVLSVVPPQGTNLQTAWSPKLATVLVEACNLIESVFYDLIASSPHYDTTTDKVQVPGEKKPCRRDRLELHHYARLYCDPLHLTLCKAVFFQAPLKWLTPFGEWSGPHDCPQPAWWAVHNASKHRRLAHFAEFTLEKALAALAGALIVLTAAPAAPGGIELLWAMVRHKWIDSPKHLHKLADYFAGKYMANHHIVVETALFAALFAHSSLPTQVEGLWRQGYFSPYFLMGGEKLLIWGSPALSHHPIIPIWPSDTDAAT